MRAVSWCARALPRLRWKSLRQLPCSSTLAKPQYSLSSTRCSSSSSSNPAPKPESTILTGSCSCGSTGWEATGTSSFNFICHCSICRQASGEPFTKAVGFKPNQVQLRNVDNISRELPKGSKNERLYCKSCKTYLGENASKPLGIMAMPLNTVQPTEGRQVIEECYQPNHHIFYENRTVDAADSIPKWKTLPPGESLDQESEHDGRITVGYEESSGRYFANTTALSPTRPPYPDTYTFTESDPVAERATSVPPEKIRERVQRKYYPSPGDFIAPSKTKRDVIIIGGGHNGLVSAAYLAKKGLDVLVLERRHCVGGAAVTEEVVPGFKFSRASYLAGLLRPQIISDLGLEKYGFKYIPRDPSSFTPTRMNSDYGGKYLILGENEQQNWDSIAQFSKRDADNFPLYEEFLGKIREILQPLLDGHPPVPFQGNLKERLSTLKQVRKVIKLGAQNKEILIPFYELLTAPASLILDRWFDSEILKTTLATDAVIGAMLSPKDQGSAYVLLHHVMGEAAGKKGVWSYVEGGMGAVSKAIADSAEAFGTEIVLNATVKSLKYSSSGKPRVTGVEMSDGTVIEADTILSNCTPYHTFLELLPGDTVALPDDFRRHMAFQDYSGGSMKINLAINELPNFECFPSPSDGSAGPQHRGTIHFESLMQELEDAHREASIGIPASRPIVEMTLPSSLDRTVAPEGKHVAQLFVQFAPYSVDPKIGSWADPNFKRSFVNRVYSIVDEFAPNFSSSIIGEDALSPLDLERVFGLQQGNIMHGALSLNQLFYARPMPGFSSHRTPLKGLYLCGAGAHPGGGVMGAAGRNCANVVLSDLRR